MSKSTDPNGPSTLRPVKQTFRVTYNAADSEPLVQTIVRAVADIRSVDAKTLPPLYEIVDGDALDGLFERHNDSQKPTRISVTFEYVDLAIAVDSRGIIEIHRPE